MQTLAIYRGLLVRTDCENDRNGCTVHRRLLRSVAAEPRRDDRGREMFFLLRMAFWLGLVLVLLPREKTPESDKLPQVGASEAVSAASAAVSGKTQFCKAPPGACAVGGQAAARNGPAAHGGARQPYRLNTDKK